MLRFVLSSPLIAPPRIIENVCKPCFVVARFWGSRPSKPLPDGFITIPEDKIHIDVRKYGRVDQQNSDRSSVNRVMLSFNVDSASWMPNDIKSIFKEQQASHIDESGNFFLVSSLHRSLVANRVEGMRKIQKKVNHAYITKRRSEGTIVMDPLVKEKRMKEKRMRSELNRKRQEIDDINEEEFF